MKDRKKLQHIHSSIADKQPTPATLEVGEIAVNNAADKEFLSLKNSNDKVVRFSSDEQLITWMEKKEVMPYVGYVRGDAGPSATSGDSPTADSMGSYGISNNDLLNNTSEIVIKLNQVVAKNTNKYNKVNASTDRYNKDVNPTTDSGLTDGAGFFIDMSRYAMRGGNPSFSSITVTDKTDLYGNTTIADGQNSHGTDTGHTLTITTTDVVANDTNWTETITNKTSKITTLNESATTRTTNVGTENLTVSGTTTEVHTGDVTISNKANVTATTDGNETKTISGDSTVNVSGDSTVNVNGDFYLNTPNLNISADTFIEGNVCVTGTVTATQAIYSSDRNLKENISGITDYQMNSAYHIPIKSFNFKNDENKNRVYGVIAQEVQDAGLGELVYKDKDEHLAVDYTSLLLIKIARLELLCDTCLSRIVYLENAIREIKKENK